MFQLEKVRLLLPGFSPFVGSKTASSYLLPTVCMHGGTAGQCRLEIGIGFRFPVITLVAG